VKKRKPLQIVVLVLSLGAILLGIGCIYQVAHGMWEYNQEAVREVSIYHPVANSVATKALDSMYPKYPADGDYIGSMTMLDQKMSIYQGWNVKELAEGVGHDDNSVLPGEKDNCVVAGHRETVFKYLGKLTIGDRITFQTGAGIFVYQVTSTKIVKANDQSAIFSTAPKATLTLITCYPFNTPGYYPDRYIVYAALV
jgi:sortase A